MWSELSTADPHDRDMQSQPMLPNGHTGTTQGNRAAQLLHAMDKM